MSRLAHAERMIFDVPTIRPHVLAMATMQSQSMVIVRLVDTAGVEGFDEGTTIGGLSYVEESPESIKSAIDDHVVYVLEQIDITTVGAAMKTVN